MNPTLNKNGEIVKFDRKQHADRIMKLAHENYTKEFSRFDFLKLNDLNEFRSCMNNKLDKMNGLVYLKNGDIKGYILYSTYKGDSETYCIIPVWGYGAEVHDREKVILVLFQKLAQDVTVYKKVTFSVNIYSHDTEIQRLFSFMEFGIQSEKGIHLLSDNNIKFRNHIRKIEKDELERRWTEVWKLLSQLIQHLKESPVFYKGNEFTEEVYKEFFKDEGTNVYIAEQDKQMIGIIETNTEEQKYISEKSCSANVGEAFVLPKYRGTKLAEELLFYAENELYNSNCNFTWVEHGTANPNARGFWNKYFSTFEYELVRKIYV